MKEKIKNIFENKKNIIIVVLIMLLLVIGGTLAIINNVDILNGEYSYQTTCFDIVYDQGEDITGTLLPSSTPQGGLNGYITIGFDENCDNTGVGNLYLTSTSNNTDSVLVQNVTPHCENISTLEVLKDYKKQSSCESTENAIWVTDGSALKYAIYDNEETTPVSVGYINKLDEKINIYDSFKVTESTQYTIHIWLDGNLSDNSYLDKSFSSTISATVEQIKPPYRESILNGADPELESGMIPVTISDTGAVTIADVTQEWYKYEDKEWANAVLVNSSKRSTYIKRDGTFNKGKLINEADILAYYVWIPRYKYTFPKADGNPETISIVFENNKTSKSIPVSGKASGTDYYTHPAFTFGTKELNGIWVGKFETGHTTLSPSTTSNNLGCSSDSCENAKGLIIKPNVQSLRNNNYSNFFYASRAMSQNGNPFGLTTSTDSHMMKNSEWGAVAYLSHSEYGINKEMYINNSSSYYTGRSAGNISGSVSPTAGGSYTWIGQTVTDTNTYGEVTDLTLGTNASTTGNVTGVFDMSSGVVEYVMGNYNGNTNSHFSILPNSKYYDKYTVTSMDDCTLSECGGHALYETKGWYSDRTGFVNDDDPWFMRGGHYSDGVYAGVFHSYSGNGSTGDYYGFRSVLVKGV